jgi:hypothetical protein
VDLSATFHKAQLLSCQVLSQAVPIPGRESVQPLHIIFILILYIIDFVHIFDVYSLPVK